MNERDEARAPQPEDEQATPPERDAATEGDSPETGTSTVDSVAETALTDTSIQRSDATAHTAAEQTGAAGSEPVDPAVPAGAGDVPDRDQPGDAAISEVAGTTPPSEPMVGEEPEDASDGELPTDTSVRDVAPAANDASEPDAQVTGPAPPAALVPARRAATPGRVVSVLGPPRSADEDRELARSTPVLPWVGWRYSLILPVALVLVVATFVVRSWWSPDYLVLTVEDRVSGAPVANARVAVGSISYETDKDGTVRIEAPSKETVITVSASGYESLTGEFTSSSRLKQDVPLRPQR